MPPISVFLLHNETSGILEEGGARVIFGCATSFGRRKLHSFWIWKKESGVDEDAIPAAGRGFICHGEQTGVEAASQGCSS
jgi:hypothetical protein